MRIMQSWDDVFCKEIGRANQGNVEAVVAEALWLGINHVETARGYGSSERQFGGILPPLKRDAMCRPK